MQIRLYVVVYLWQKTQKNPSVKMISFLHSERAAHKDKPDWHTFGELCFNSDQVVIDNNKAMRFEEFGNVKGELFQLEVYKAPFYNKDGDIVAKNIIEGRMKGDINVVNQEE